MKNLMNYNCGGYALGTLDWFTPYDRRKTFYKKDKDWYVNNFDNFVNFMKEVFINVRIITDKSEAVKGERVVAFRVGQGDFHFVKVYKSKEAFKHKIGWSIIESMSKDDFYNEEGWKNFNIRYNSKIVYLAINGKKAIYKDDFKGIAKMMYKR